MKYEEMKKTELLHGTNGQTELDIFKNEKEQEKKPRLEEHDKSVVQERHEDQGLPPGKEESVEGKYVFELIDAIEITPGHARRAFGNIDELQKSIAAIGVKHPVLVALLPDGRKVIYDGCRRHAVCKNLGIKKIPCIIKEMIEEEADRLSYIINEKRETLTFLDKLHHLKKERAKGHTLRDLEKKLGYGSAPHLSNILKLDSLPWSIINDIDSGSLTMALGHILLKLPSAELQLSMAKEIIKDRLTAQMAERRVERELNKNDEEVFEPQDNQPTEYPGIIKRRNSKMVEQTERCMSLILSLLLSAKINVGKRGVLDINGLSMNEMISDIEKKNRPGGILGMLIHDKFNTSPYGKSFLGRFLHPLFLKNNYLPRGRIIINIVDDEKIKRTFKTNADIGHTEYDITDSAYDLYIFGHREDKIQPPKVIEDQSRLSKEALIDITMPVWTYNLSDYSGYDGVLLAIAKRFICLYSYVGDSVLDPFGTNLSVVKAALELGRVPTCYIEESDYNSEELKKIFTVQNNQQPKEDWKVSVNKDHSESSHDHSPADNMANEQVNFEDSELNMHPPVQNASSANLSTPV